MGNDTVQINSFEQLGRVLDGRATGKERETVLQTIMTDTDFEECFMVAMLATTLFNEKMNAYDTVQ